MRVFEEKQQFRQWWVHVIFLIVILGISIQIYYSNSSNLQETTILFAILFLNFSLLILLYKMELHTKIDINGINTSFRPFPFFKRHYNWSEIDKIYVRKYSALTEYGGWGIRGFTEAKAYNVSGNYGIQIVTK
jgi:hypothetical protein